MHAQRWGYRAATLGRINSWKEFLKKRPYFQRQQIMENFDIPGTATVTLKTDVTKGEIIINTIRITEDIPVRENPNNWSGVYFKGIPIQIRAIPYPGYQFAGWAETGQNELDITVVLTEDLTLTARFIKTRH